jgi:DNA-binding CsgD family transcriptional regulator
VRLTAVEQRIVAAVMSGATNKEVAGRLGLAEQTVKNRLSRVYRKLGVRNRVELVAQASRARRGEHDS